MHLTRLEGAALEASWPGILATVAEAGVADSNAPDLDYVERELRRGHMQAWRVVGGAAGYAITQTVLLPGSPVTTALRVVYIAGRLLGPRRRLMRDIGAELEDIASAWGCMEIRVEGKRAGQWQRVLPGFDFVGKDVLRKVLS